MSNLIFEKEQLFSFLLSVSEKEENGKKIIIGGNIYDNNKNKKAYKHLFHI